MIVPIDAIEVLQMMKAMDEIQGKDSPRKWHELREWLIGRAEAAEQKRAPDEGYCAHDWSFPPEFCPVCNKRVPLIRLRG